jgi:hypothetical protein
VHVATTSRTGKGKLYQAMGWLSALRGPAMRELVQAGSLQLWLFEERNLAEIGLKAGKVLNRFKVGKHFLPTVAAGVFEWSRRQESIRREAELDGV